MSLFDLFKKEPSVVWRDKTGKIVCQGDNCPQKCDNTCPIWCQTMAMTLMKMGHIDKAIEELNKAVTIAPDFKEGWVNLAALYGSSNNHSEANKAYKEAYILDNKYSNALFGLIISFKNLGNFEEALRYCNEFEILVGKNEADKLRKQVSDAQNSKKEIKEQNTFEMASQIISLAHEMFILECDGHSFPNIPEIVAEGKSTCRKILIDLVREENVQNPKTWLSWGAFAGIGAVHHWNIDWNELKTNGIAETLMEPNGSCLMDEYVLDSIGIGYDTDAGKSLFRAINEISNWALQKFFSHVSQENATQAIENIMYSMYIFGMVYQMERLGMK